MIVTKVWGGKFLNFNIQIKLITIVLLVMENDDVYIYLARGWHAVQREPQIIR